MVMVDRSGFRMPLATATIASLHHATAMWCAGSCAIACSSPSKRGVLFLGDGG